MECGVVDNGCLDIGVYGWMFNVEGCGEVKGKKK